AGRGQPAAPEPPPTPVYLVRGPGGAADKMSVLVPPALLTKLEALARPAFAPPECAVLVSADYDGKVVKGAADFKAVFYAHVLSDGPAALVLPLGDVLLQGDVFVGGRNTFPVPRSAPQVGYTIPLRGKGPHRIEVQFQAPVVARGEERAVRFAA